MPLVRHSSRHGCCSTAGRRAINEDRAATLSVAGNLYVAVVADGMGGARAGDIASDAAMKAFVRSVRSANGSSERTMLRTAFAAADQAIRDAVTPERQGMGSTLVAAIARESDIWIGNIGDSRAVLVTRDDVIPLSKDHSVVGEELRSGRITEVEALRHPERHVISRAIGDGDAKPDVKFHSFQHERSGTGALVLLGSDGLFNFIGDSEILELAEEARTAGELAERVVRRAVDNGSDDNVTAASIIIDPRRRRLPLAIAVAMTLFLALAAGAYVKRNAIAERLSPARVTRIRLPADQKRPLRAGMSGSLCGAPNDCFAVWRVVAADGSSVILEIRMNERGRQRSKR